MHFSLLWLISIKSMACFTWQVVARMLRNEAIHPRKRRTLSLP
jgi:hypothetical protein